jgi:hypothetical protein
MALLVTSRICFDDEYSGGRDFTTLSYYFRMSMTSRAFGLEDNRRLQSQL